jgi:hypothetical protein
MNETLRMIFATVMAGIVGTVTNAVAAALLIHPVLMDFAMMPARYLVAIFVAGQIPLFKIWVGGPSGLTFAFIGLTLVPSLLAKFVFGTESPWILVLVLNAVFAIGALATYNVIAGESGD